MQIEEWEARYRGGERAAEDLLAAPALLVVDWAGKLPPGTAFDLACGAGRNALWLARQGWKVAAVDGSATAIATLMQRARDGDLEIEARVADLEAPDFTIEAARWDLILKCYYLQRSLIPAVREGLRPGGTAIVIVHLANPGEEVTYHRAAPGELRGFFADWEILYYYEGPPNDPAHKRAVAKIVAKKPL